MTIIFATFFLLYCLCYIYSLLLKLARFFINIFKTIL